VQTCPASLQIGIKNTFVHIEEACDDEQPKFSKRVTSDVTHDRGARCVESLNQKQLSAECAKAECAWETCIVERSNPPASEGEPEAEPLDANGHRNSVVFEDAMAVKVRIDEFGVKVEEHTFVQPEWSAGSVGHTTGDCKPCAWFWKGGACMRGTTCTFCHVCGEGEMRRRKREKRAASRHGLAGIQTAETLASVNGENWEDDGLYNIEDNTSELWTTADSGVSPSCAFDADYEDSMPTDPDDFGKSRGPAISMPYCKPSLPGAHEQLPAGVLPPPQSYANCFSEDAQLRPNLLVSRSSGSSGRSSGVSELTDLHIIEPHASIGSVGHDKGVCRPCVWFWRPTVSCNKGPLCEYCHLCDEGALKRSLDSKKRNWRKPHTKQIPVPTWI